MSYTNYVTKSVLEVLGDITSSGYSFYNIPILLNKDIETYYPEIRVSPFVDKFDLYNQNNIEKTFRQYRDWEGGIFQIDIYSKSFIEAQNIYDALIDRIYDFFNLETLIYNNNDEFEEIDTNIFKNYAYGIGDLFKDIYSIRVEEQEIKRVYTFDDIDIDSYFVDQDALYICTKKNLKTFQVKVLLQGRLFNNGDAYSDRGLHYYSLSGQRTLSSLEDNDVERISFDMYILYSHKREREPISRVKKVAYPRPRVR